MNRILFSIKSYGLVTVLLIVIYVVYNLIYSDDHIYQQTNSVEDDSIYFIDVSNFNKKIANISSENLPERKIVNFGYGLRLYDWEGNFIDSDSLTVSSNNELNFIVSMVNASGETDHVGFYLFVDGLIQSFSVDGAPPTYLYSTELPHGSVINVPITSKIRGIANKEKHELFVVMQYHMTEIPGVRYQYIDFYTNSFSKQVYFTTSNLLENRHFEVADQQIANEFDGKISYNSIRMVVADAREKNILSQQPIQLHASEVSNIELLLRGFGKPGRYSTVVFIDNHPLKAGGDFEIFWEQQHGTMFERNLSINIPDRPGKYIMHCITVPLNNEIPFAIGSQKFMLEII